MSLLEDIAILSEDYMTTWKLYVRVIDKGEKDENITNVKMDNKTNNKIKIAMISSMNAF